MKEVPPRESDAQRDPWLNEVLDGQTRKLTAVDWKGRYKSAKSAQSAIHQAARKRGIRASIETRGTEKDPVLYVTAILGVNGTPTKAAAVKRTPAKKAPVKATPRKRASATK